jgi:hypothetical protein
MARVFPMLSEANLDLLPSRAEAMVYRACRDMLGPDIVVLFSLSWIKIGAAGSPRDGETDFIIIDPAKGFLFIEVKGGGVGTDPRTGEWYSIDRNSVRHRIKDPFGQAKTEKYAFQEYLNDHRDWQRLKIRPVMGHAVLFPDLDNVTSLSGPDRPDRIIGTRQDLTRFAHWISSVLAFWSSGQRAPDLLGAQAMAVVDRIFCQTVEVRPLLSAILRDEELERIRLTEEQARLLRGLSLRKRAVVSGGAGTGKTLLALQKARQLAAEHMQTLLLCYNRPLANHLKRCSEDISGLLVMSFHQLCDWFVRVAKEHSGRDLLAEAELSYAGQDRYGVHFPFALALAIECVDSRFDAIIVDEAQDFGEEFWLPIELLLRDPESSTFFIFYDHNQSVYKRCSTFPIKDEPFLLTRNCRNTRCIHEGAYRFYAGEPTEPPTIAGTPIEMISAPSLPSQAKRLQAIIVDLIARQAINPTSLAVLVPSRGHDDYYSLLRNLSLPRPTRWAFEEHDTPDGVIVETAQRFKGLESEIVFFWGADMFDLEDDREILYVTLTRAKSRLYLVGDEERCLRFVGGESFDNAGP